MLVQEWYTAWLKVKKIIASFKVFSWFDTIIHQKIEKVSQKKYFLDDFTSNHPIATQIPDLRNG